MKKNYTIDKTKACQNYAHKLKLPTCKRVYNDKLDLNIANHIDSDQR